MPCKSCGAHIGHRGECNLGDRPVSRAEFEEIKEKLEEAEMRIRELSGLLTDANERLDAMYEEI